MPDPQDILNDALAVAVPTVKAHMALEKEIKKARTGDTKPLDEAIAKLEPLAKNGLDGNSHSTDPIITNFDKDKDYEVIKQSIDRLKSQGVKFPANTKEALEQQKEFEASHNKKTSSAVEPKHLGNIAQTSSVGRGSPS